MKKWKFLLIVGAMVLGCAGCGEQKQEGTGAVDVKPVDVVQTDETETESTPTESETEEKNDSYEDLEEKGAEGETAVFAEQIQAAMAEKDLDALAKLCAYPLAVNGEAVENEEAFMALGADRKSRYHFYRGTLRGHCGGRRLCNGGDHGGRHYGGCHTKHNF